MTIEPRNVLPLDEFRTLGLAGVSVGAIAKAQFIHLGDHLLYSVGSLDFTLGQQSQMANLGTDKQHGAGIFASRHTSAAADARSRIHGHVGLVLWNRNRIGIGDTARGGADVAACLDDLVEGGAVHHQVADNREGFGTPRFNPNVIAVLELPHVKLAGGDAIVVAMGTTVDIESAHAADAFAAVVVEAYGMRDVVVDEPFVQDVEHLKERTVRRDVVDGVGLEMAFGTCVLLSPNM